MHVKPVKSSTYLKDFSKRILIRGVKCNHGLYDSKLVGILWPLSTPRVCQVARQWLISL